MDKSKPFGLVIPKKAGGFRPKICNAFESDSDDDKTSKKKSTKIPQSKPVNVKTEDLCDPSIYEYDAIYDDMKAQKAAEVAPKVTKSSRYIDHLLKAADKRKKEYERRVERKVQVEREKEGDKFEDKEMFVSATYKKKLQEREEEEERERRENQLNEMMDVTKQKDLSGFYRHFLKQSVGEEKIPVFGERHAVKREPLDESDKEKNSSFEVKKEPLSESDQEQSSSKADIDSKSTHSVLDKDFEDSDDSSSVEGSENEAENSYERSVRVQNPLEKNNKDIYDKRLEEKNPGDKLLESRCTKRRAEELSEKLSVKNSKKRTKIFSEEENEDLSKSVKKSEQVNLKHHGLKNSAKRLESIENVIEEGGASDTEKEISDSDDRGMIDSNVKEVSTNGTEKGDNKEKCKPNIYEKRAVGDLFAAAQARYFQRLAARSVI